MMNAISKDQALEAVRLGEFGHEIINSSGRVVVILTQGWCSQWHAMKSFILDFSGAAIWFLEYDLTDYFDMFRQFKEQVLGNDQIPYIRYYTDGVLIAESNAVSELTFRTHLGVVNS